MDDGGEVVKTISIVGRGSLTPRCPAEVSIRYAVRSRGVLLESTPGPQAVMLSGGGRAPPGTRVFPAAVERAICTMTEGEKATIELRGGVSGRVGDDAAVQYEVELCSWMDVIDVLGDGTILVKPICTPMPSRDTPRDIDMVRIRYCGRVLGGSSEVFVNEGFGPSWCDGPDADVVLRKLQLRKIEPEGLRVALRQAWQGCSFLVELEPERAFGTSDVSVSGCVIPGASRVEFKAELCELSTVEDLSGDGGVLLETLFEPAEVAAEVRPMEGSTCCVTYQSAVQGDGPQAGRQFESYHERFVCIGQVDSPLTDGLERALQAMIKGQACIVKVSPEYAYGSEGFRGMEGHVAPGEPVEHRVTLLDFKPVGNAGFKAMAFGEQVEFAQSVKEVGNALFKAGGAHRLRRAICRYQAVDSLLAVPDHRATAATCKAALDTRASALANVAACRLSLREWAACIAAATQVLKLEPRNSKALYRRAVANVELGRQHEAESDLGTLSALAPDDKAVQALKRRLSKEMRAADAEKRSLFADMFR